jgi:hypothetical protein
MHQPNAHSYSGRAAAKPCEPSHTLRGLRPVDHRNRPNIVTRDYNANFTLPTYNGNGTFMPLSIAKQTTSGQPTATFGAAGPGDLRLIQLAAQVYF